MADNTQKPRFALVSYADIFRPHVLFESDDLAEVCAAIPDWLDAEEDQLSVMQRLINAAGKRKLHTLFQVQRYDDPTEEG